MCDESLGVSKLSFLNRRTRLLTFGQETVNVWKCPNYTVLFKRLLGHTAVRGPVYVFKMNPLIPTHEGLFSFSPSYFLFFLFLPPPPPCFFVFEIGSPCVALAVLKLTL